MIPFNTEKDKRSINQQRTPRIITTIDKEMTCDQYDEI